MIKAVFFDIDGTLASFKTHEISAESIRTLTELRRLGIRLYIATGRHFLCIDNLGNFPFDGYICMNGAVIYNDGKIIFRKPLDRNDSQTVALVARDRHIPCAVFSENSIGMNFIDDGSREVLRMVRMPDPPIVPFPECADEPVYQYTVFADRRQAATFVQAKISLWGRTCDRQSLFNTRILRFLVILWLCRRIAHRHYLNLNISFFYTVNNPVFPVYTS